MYKYSLLILILFIGAACENTKKETTEPTREAKSVYIKKYTFPEFTPKATEQVSNWYEFKTIYQILLSISPEKQSVSLLQGSHPDSLYVYKRLYPNTSESKLLNGSIQQDWRAWDTPSDTVYKFVKRKSDEKASFAWKEILLKDIPYTFSIRMMPSAGIKEVRMEVVREKDKKTIREQSLRLDSLSLNTLERYTKVTPLMDTWVRADMQVETLLEGEYTFAIHYDEKEVAEDYISFVRTELLLPEKYQEEIEKSGDKLLGKGKTIKSSYNSIYFWLFQLEDELRQLWAKGNFPEKLDRDEIKSRLKLFETYVRSLSSNVKEDPNLSKESVQEGILEIRNAFASVISYINFLCEENLDDKLGTLLNSTDTLSTQ